ncbi:MAG: tandem-95 repeat protein, partial [Gemmataceae bacterium]
MLKTMRDITKGIFLGKYPYPIRNDRKKSLLSKLGLELLDQRIAPAVDAVAQLVGNGMGADQTPWYAVQGGPNGGMQFDVSEAYDNSDVYLGQGVSSLDIVGDEDQGSIYMAFDPASGGSVFNRMRIGDITNATYMQRAYVGMDFNADGQVDLYTSANGSNSTVEILLPIDHDANPATIDNTSPENTAFAIYSSTPGVAGNYAVTLVSASSDPQPGGTDIGSKADGNPDQFVSWKVSLPDLDSAWKVVQSIRGIAPGAQTSFDQDSPFRIISFTFGSVTVEDPRLTDINGVTKYDGGSGPGSNTDGYPIWDKGASPGPGIPAGLDVYSKSITLSCLVPPEIAPPFSFQMKEETTKYVTDVNITGSNSNPYMDFSLSGTDADDFSIDAKSGVLTFKTLPDFEAPVDSNGDNIYSVSVTITNCVGSDTKLFTVEILDAGEFAPVAVDDSASTNEDVSIVIAALANDTDADVGQAATLVVGTYESKTSKGGSVTLSPDGKTFNYTPALDFNGTDSFNYQAMDVDGKLSNTATVTITVNPVNDAPVAVNDSYSTNEDTTLDVPVPGVLLNDTDVDGDPLTVYGVSGASHGTVILSIDGKFTYTPDPDFHGEDSFIYSVTDGKDISSYATVKITVNPVNDAPVAINDSYSTNEDVVLNIAGPGV